MAGKTVGAAESLEQRFPWVPFYEELAHQVVRRRKQLPDLLSGLQRSGVELGPGLGTEGPGGTPFEWIDPFTFFAIFNRGASTRATILRRIAELWQMKSAPPDEFHGIPTVNNLRSWFLPHAGRSADLSDLWALATAAVGGGPDALDAAVFGRCVAVHCVGFFKLTMGLFWLAPRRFLPLDKKTRRLLESVDVEVRPEDGLDGYRRVLDETRKNFAEDFVSLSHRAHLEATGAEDDDPPEPEVGQFWKIAPERNATLWSVWLDQKHASIGWNNLGDLSGISREEFDRRCADILAKHPDGTKASMEQAWNFSRIPVGAKLVANKGISRVVGIGTVTGPYYFVPSPDHGHRLPVDWHDTRERAIQRGGWRKTLIRLRQADFEEIERASSPVEEERRPPPPPPPVDLSFEGLLAELGNRGLAFSDELLATYLLALQTKRFVILSGISGTGKTQLAKAVGELLSSPEAPGSQAVDRARSLATPQVGVVAVRPDWTDNRGLLGFYNPLSNTYQATPFLRLVLAAAEEQRAAALDGRPPRPFFAVLDEMNLARVEHYFSDFLSCAESDDPLHLHDASGSAGVQNVPATLRIPPNLFFTGTVNVDETTYMFSPKVLDRAFVLELDQVELNAYGAEADSAARGPACALSLGRFPGQLLAGDKPSMRDWMVFKSLADGVLAQAVVELNDVLQQQHRHFGYRVANEIARFVCLVAEQADDSAGTLWNGLDVAVTAKVLPKLHGTQQELASILFALQEHVGREDGGRRPLLRAKAKLERMQLRLQQQGHTSFIE